MPAASKGAVDPTSRKPISVIQNPIFFITTLVIFFALGLGSGYLVWGSNTAVEAVEAGADNTVQITRHVVEEGGNPSIGPADAAVTIIEFSDYQCPYCQRWHEQVFNRLLQEYPEQVRIVYRDMPLGGHPQAAPAAEAANCANEQDAFWPYHDKIFSYEYDLSRDTYLLYADELNLDMPLFTDCLDSGRYADEVAADLSYTRELGISSTPTFFINGIFVEGALPYESFKSIIDQELAGELP